MFVLTMPVTPPSPPQIFCFKFLINYLKTALALCSAKGEGFKMLAEGGVLFQGGPPLVGVQVCGFDCKGLTSCRLSKRAKSQTMGTSGVCCVLYLGSPKQKERDPALRIRATKGTSGA